MANLPITESEHDKVGDGWHITTTVTVSDNGRVDGVVKLENYNNISGFKGGSVILLGNADGNILWGSRTHKTGVNATGFSRKTSAKEHWEETVPSDIISSVSRVVIINKKTPDDNLWKQRISEGISIAKDIIEVANSLE